MITVNIEVINNDISIDPSTVELFVKKVISKNGIQNGEITVIFGDDETVKNLKHRFFGKNEPTDVIAFRIDTPGNNEIFEGEIYISVQRAFENASRYHVSPANELSRLIFHGSLHLVGFDDDSIKKQIHMRHLENQFMADVAVEDLLT